jgi:hypothetical protein
MPRVRGAAGRGQIVSALPDIFKFGPGPAIHVTAETVAVTRRGAWLIEISDEGHKIRTWMKPNWIVGLDGSAIEHQIAISKEGYESIVCAINQCREGREMDRRLA